MGVWQQAGNACLHDLGRLAYGRLLQLRGGGEVGGVPCLGFWV